MQSVNVFPPTLKSSWTQYWNHLLKTWHLCGRAQSCQFIQKWSSCSSYMLLSQCIQKFHFNCFFTPVVRGLKQLLPCTSSYCSASGSLSLVMHHVASVCAILPLESWSRTSELTWRKSARCMKWWPQIVKLCRCWLVFHLPVALLVAPLPWKAEKWLQHELERPADEKTVKYEMIGRDSRTCHPAEVALSENCQRINAKKLHDQVTDEINGLFWSVTWEYI